MVGPSFPYVVSPGKIRKRTNKYSKCRPIIRKLQLTVVIWWWVSGIPTITLFLQALIANMERAFEHRTISPLGRSRIKWMISSKSMKGEKKKRAKFFVREQEPKKVVVVQPTFHIE